MYLSLDHKIPTLQGMHFSFLHKVQQLSFLFVVGSGIILCFRHFQGN